jgi:hypothetical protein
MSKWELLFKSKDNHTYVMVQEAADKDTAIKQGYKSIERKGWSIFGYKIKNIEERRNDGK